ncbi:hypothetical protein LTR16_000763 [Cryomyces antarcticus]|uniref:Major facilitator superfamily (MFS) profile domain-containing protein n=1 Tax=Cryomyces antarcticus TaxID=329879 RepID=A0ABR0KUD7_9PEZI|nr:hypothetical protein LTR39_000528 [Cryomyces antarcticus]KAK5131434.1 hypothetical protein LTR16_000763 [Cryomyces antarcticus]
MVGRFVTGIGTGIETSTVPMYQSELSHAHQRGRLVCSEALFVGVGIVIAYWFDYGMNFVGGAIAWRLPVGFQIIFTFVVIFLVFGLPESPRYLYNQGRAKEGLQVLCDVYNKEPEHPEIVKEQQDILDAIEMEAHRGKSWLELFKPDRVQTRKRILLAYGMQFMNQVGGINLVVYFVPTVLQENVGLTRNLSLLLGGVINCMFVIGSFVPALLVDRIGRRQPMMWGSLGLGISMMMIAVLLSFKGSANEHATSSASVAFFFTEQTPAQSGPYPPATQSLGGLPTIGVDVPITSVFLVLFVVGAVGHMTIFQLNIRAKRKFIPSAMLFGLCLIRTISCALRMGWATHPRSINVAIAANVFVYAGTIILYLINILFAQRIVRATHPSIGWSQAFTSVVILIMALIVVTLIMVVTVTIQSIFTLSIHTHHIDRSIQLYGSTFNVVIAFLPFLVTIISLAIPRRSKHDHFGSGSSSAKMLILLGSSGLITLGAGFRAGTSWSPPTPLTSPSPWYLSKACFYIFNFTVEILIIYSYLVLRVDKRFIIRNGAKGPGSYSLNGTTIEDAGDSDNVESSSTTEQEKTPEDSDGLRRLMSTGEMLFVLISRT